MAKDVRVILKGDARDANAAIKSMQSTGSQAASILEREFSQLGMKSAQVFENQRLAADKAYERIKSSGLATASELQRAQKAHADRLREIDREQNGTTTSAGKLNQALTTMTAVLAGIGIVNTARSLVDAQIAIDKIHASMNTTFGQGSGAEIAFLRGEADRLGLAFNSTAESYGRFAAAAKGSAISAEETRRIFTSVAEASTAMGLSADETSGILNALQQMVSKGTVQAEELRGQLGERLPGAFRMAAQSMGVTEQQLGKMMERGEVLAADLLPKLATALHDKFGKAAEEASSKAQQSLNRMISSFETLKTIAAESVGVDKLMASTADELAWFVEMVQGNVSPLEWFFSFDDKEKKEKLESLKKAALDASVTNRAKSAEEILAEKQAADELARVKAEAAQKADEEAKKKHDKELEEIRKHNDRILDIEKKRVSKSLELESEHLRKLTGTYAAAVASMDSLIDARKTVQEQLAARNAADLARGAGPVDPLNAYLNQQEQIRRAEETINASFGMSAEEKAKKYADLIDQAASYNQAVVDGSAEIVSTYQTEADYQATKERLQERISQLLDVEAAKRTAAAEDFGVQMIAAEEKVSRFKDEIERLEDLLDRMNHKEVNIIFRATGAEQLMKAAGMAGGSPGKGGAGLAGAATVSGLPTTDISTPFGATFHTGTSYVPRDGLYRLTRGESVVNRTETERASTPAAPVTIAPVFQINGIAASGAQKTARELAREIEPEMRKLAGRIRG